MTVTANNFILSITTVLLIGYGCKTVEKSTDQGAGTISDTTVTEQQDNATGIVTLLNSTRSKLSDVYLTQRHNMPEVFLKTSSSDDAIRSNPFAGFRVQIHSSRNMQMADSLAGSYRVWSDTTLAGYKAPVYVTFRQPYYRVQIGDFHQRERAYSFSKLIKKEFPDAWVVHQRIDPAQVPADSVGFSYQSQKKDSLNAADSTKIFQQRNR